MPKVTPALRQIYPFLTMLQQSCNMHPPPPLLKTCQIYVKCTAIFTPILFYQLCSFFLLLLLSLKKYAKLTPTLRQIDPFLTVLQQSFNMHPPPSSKKCQI
jgi:hypothetical protein